MLTQLQRTANSRSEVSNQALSALVPADLLGRQWQRRFMPREFAQQRGLASRFELIPATMVA